MIEVTFLVLLALAWIIFASVEDLKKREVANWLNFSLIVFALGFRFFYSLFNGNYSFFLQGLFGLVIFFVIGNLLYYSRMFAGGDAKMMIALGAILGFSGNFLINLKIYFLFLFLFLFGGAVYGVSATLYLSLKYRMNFKKDFVKKVKENKRIILSIMVLGLFFIILGFFQTPLLIFGALVFILPVFYVYVKTVDSVCMVRDVETKGLSEGEWLYKPVKIGRRVIKPSWEGLSAEEVKLIKKKYKIIRIKVGIAFLPVFLIAFLALWYLWETGLWNLFW
ncbi:MAG: A24 family peptidase [Nanoarchaeota archaeon]